MGVIPTRSCLQINKITNYIKLNSSQINSFEWEALIFLSRIQSNMQNVLSITNWIRYVCNVKHNNHSSRRVSFNFVFDKMVVSGLSPWWQCLEGRGSVVSANRWLNTILQHTCYKGSCLRQENSNFTKCHEHRLETTHVLLRYKILVTFNWSKDLIILRDTSMYFSRSDFNPSADPSFLGSILLDKALTEAILLNSLIKSM